MASLEERVEDLIKQGLRGHKINYFTKTEKMNPDIDKALRISPSKQGGAEVIVLTYVFLLTHPSKARSQLCWRSKGTRASLLN